MPFDFDFTLYKIDQIIPSAKYGSNVWYKELKNLLPIYKITSLNSVSAFLAITIYESNGYMQIEESFNYDTDTLVKLWPKHFTNVSAKAYAFKEQSIANKVYANRFGNRNEESGDGWNYRSRGLLPLIGKEKYKKFAQVAGLDLDECISYLESPHGIIHAACWLWDLNKFNDYANRKDIQSIVSLLTNSLLNIDDHTENFNIIKNILKE
ncbi:MAG: hypothetical protein ACO25Q_06925 [Sediminibacterium sp.]